MQDIVATEKFVSGLKVIRARVEELDRSRNINRATQYECSEATKALYAFVISGDSAFLQRGDERLRRVLAMGPLSMREELTAPAKAMLDAATSLTPEDRQRLAGGWTDTFGSGAVPASLREDTVLEAGLKRFGDNIDLVRDVLRRLSIGLERWPVISPGGSGATPWQVDNEYHFQSLLWLALAPALPGLSFEEYTTSPGRTRPRIDFTLPKSELAIEAKFVRRPSDFQRVEDQITVDAHHYTESQYSTYSRLIAVIWDQTRSTECYGRLIDALLGNRGVIGAFVIPRPHRMGSPSTSGPTRRASSTRNE